MELMVIAHNYSQLVASFPGSAQPSFSVAYGKVTNNFITWVRLE